MERLIHGALYRTAVRSTSNPFDWSDTLSGRGALYTQEWEPICGVTRDIRLAKHEPVYCLPFLHGQSATR